jgi:hypothetical protein
MSNKLNVTVATMGIDIGKNSFHIVGLDRRGAIVLRQKWSRSQVEARLAAMPPCLIGMEASVGAHHLSRRQPHCGRGRGFRAGPRSAAADRAIVPWAFSMPATLGASRNRNCGVMTRSSGFEPLLRRSLTARRAADVRTSRLKPGVLA